MGIGMKKFFVYFLLLIFTLHINAAAVFSTAHPVKTVAVITDTGHRHGTNYLICGAASDIIATDLVNRINMTNRMKAPLLGDTMSKITQTNIPLYYMTFLNDYKYNYNIDFVNLKRVTKNIPADYLLLVTSGLDVQSNFLKDTWWNKLNIPGMDPVKPTYQLATLITLIDKKNYRILWQDMYLKDIEAHNYDLGIVHFSPSYAQLAKIKKYSRNMSEYVTNIVDKQVNPWIVPPKEPKSVEMRSKFVNEGTKVYYPAVNGVVVKQNFNNLKDNTKRKYKQMRQNYEQKKHIENVRKLEKKHSLEQQKLQKTNQIEQTIENTRVKKLTPINQNIQTKDTKKKQNQKLFDSIRDDIDGISNTLPEPAVKQQEVKPAVQTTPVTETQNKNTIQINNQQNKQEPEITKPVLRKPVNPDNAEKQTQKSNIKPSANKITKPKVQQNEELKTNPKDNYQEIPHYDWNLKNIYLQKIGSAYLM